MNSGSWPTQKRSGFDSPVGVASLSSRSPGSAFAAIVTRRVTVSAIAGFWFLLGAKRKSFCRMSAASLLVRGGPDDIRAGLRAGCSAAPLAAASRGRPLLLQFLELVPQVVDLLLRQRPGVLDHLGLNAGAGDVRVGGAVQILPADRDLERGALPAAGGIDVADVRGVAARWAAAAKASSAAESPGPKPSRSRIAKCCMRRMCGTELRSEFAIVGSDLGAYDAPPFT